MADPTFTGRVSRGYTAAIGGGIRGTGDDVLTGGYQNCVPLFDKANNEIHIILSSGTLAKADLDDDGTYNDAPLGSLLIHITASSVAMFLKEAASGDAAWTKITTEAHGL